ncbi:LemA family protein [Pedobacter puniceum]|jgi:LemA protein|uniref:LemA family protein n=1 Tax=Pedobacter puniceum TaxID=2666136 RepID=A0A7K0FT68_9SPHI|nr:MULTISPECIES: LemA family protein [Pedobacter]KHJ36506.1 LemA family protein [Pedobacter glucosidilyticus]MRX48841.1 LemA family protein [Pedobacter puniceum]
MKKLLYGFLAVVIATSLSSCGYNSSVKLDEKVKAQWGEVENQYQRRADLIPNLVNTVKGVSNFEKETLTQVIEARAKATSVQVDPTKLTPETLQKFQASQGQLSQALGRLMVVSEQYPELKANQNFLELQAQLEGTENRITVARRDFNQAVQEYNTNIRTFPNNIFAGMFGFTAKGSFAAEAGAEKAPEVKF